MKRIPRRGISRRDFLKLTGAAGAASMLPFSPLRVLAQGDPQSGGTLIEARTYELVDLDPATTLNTEAGQIVMPRFYESLVTTGADLQAVPKLATSWKLVDDVTWEFKIRQGVKFHDGQDLMVEDVQFSYERILDPEVGHPANNRMGAIESVEIVDEETIRFILSAPNAIFPRQQDWSFIHHRSVADQPSDWLLSNVNGTGPFRLDSWRPDIEMRLIRHDDYWQEGKPYLDGIVMNVFAEESSALAALRTGEAHFLTLEDPNNYALLTGNADLNLLEVPSNGGIFWCWNGNREPMDDVMVRRAISAAINREEVLELVGAGLGNVSGVITSAFTDVHVPASDLPYYQYDVDLARQLLSESSVPDGFAMDCIFIDALPIMKNGAQLFQQYMEAIGIEVELRSMETNTWVETVLETEDFYFTTNLDLGGPTPEAILNAIACDGWAAPVYGPCSEDIDAMVQAAAAATSADDRVALWRDIQIAVAEFQPTATWIYARNHVVAARTEVQGFVPFPDKAHRQLEDVWIAT